MKKSSADFKTLAEEFLGTPMPDRLSDMKSLPVLSSEAQGLVTRAFKLMKRAGYTTAQFNPYLIQWLSASIPNMMPEAWGGRIPPLTLPGRHKKLDDYVIHRAWSPESGRPPVFVDAGCGFPPVTTADTARVFPDWRIFGVDRSFAEYVLYDREGHYACFDDQGVFLYFQRVIKEGARALHPDPEASRKHFIRLFDLLLPLLPENRGLGSQTVEQDGHRLVHRHIRDFETNRLTFIQDDIENLELPAAKVVRCMNVLIYFEPEVRERMLFKVGNLLDEDGLLIAGTNGVGIQARYAVYRRSRDELTLKEFAFSPDNLGHIVFMPWLTFHENDPEAMLLAELTGAIRANSSFWPEFSLRLDELLEENSICQREAQGFLRFPQELQPPIELLKKDARLWQQVEEEGYLDRMVDVLRQAGYDAWKNSVGDIAVQPPAHF